MHRILTVAFVKRIGLLSVALWVKSVGGQKGQKVTIFRQTLQIPITEIIDGQY